MVFILRPSPWGWGCGDRAAILPRSIRRVSPPTSPCTPLSPVVPSVGTDGRTRRSTTDGEPRSHQLHVLAIDDLGHGATCRPGRPDPDSCDIQLTGGSRRAWR